MNQDQSAIASALRAILADHSTQESVIAAEGPGFAEEAWKVLGEGGFASISIPESAGGSGGDLADACVVLHEVGRAAAAVPFAEHTLLAGWALAEAGRALPEGVSTMSTRSSESLSVTAADGGAVLDGVLTRVPWASNAAQIVVLADLDGAAQLIVVPTASVTIEPGRNVALESRDLVRFDKVSVPADAMVAAPASVTAEALELRAALSRAALISGALERVTEVTVRYTAEREQFGRPIARFQAVQRHLVRIAEQSVSAQMAVDAAATNAVTGLDFFDIASAKIVASEAAGIVSAASHQAHGAIGMTKEYELGQLTRRLWSWRDECGSEASWSRRLGAHLAEEGADALWPRITTGLAPERRNEKVAGR
ncbi:acyl-CoA dehydrogenase [Antricoccus suffuscus]|uniref:Acyl-CoA dehydrogenase n=1 Tax=Antricoccus suffuscus TaxID=1629062 RepID=A0A2T1A261_9ACTN|nr:acyl-CoA dehydrogenase family protein [Antricoccus suffuscus]PRZ42418.1 acyl-CoA dehydrogenase [Antricoccus suffuscus]